MNRLKELRKDNKILQKDIANYLNIKQNSYSQYENGIRDLSTSNLKKIALFYNVCLDYILNLTDIKDMYAKSNVIQINPNMTRLKDVREDRDLFQKDIAKEIDINLKSYSTYETGLCDISTNTLKKLALYYNVSIDYLLYMTDDRIIHKRKDTLN